MKIEDAAQALWRAEKTREQTGLLSQAWPGMTMDDAYRVQAAYVALRSQAQIGWKIGLTSRAMQSQLGIATPDSGVLTADMRVADGAVVPNGRYIAPRVEAEIAFVMGADLGPDPSRDEVLAATAAVAPALEILDTRIVRADPATGRSRTILDTIADNAANGGLVLGLDRHPPRAMDLPWIGAVLRRDGVVEETGLGAGVLGDPVVAVIWLARRLATYGARITAGQIILSGSFIRAVEAPPGSRFAADFGHFGQVAVAFA